VLYFPVSETPPTHVSRTNSRDWLDTTIDEFVSILDSYIRWYNEARIKISLGSHSPIEYRMSIGLAA
jgi:transposase InsO family protein